MSKVLTSYRHQIFHPWIFEFNRVPNTVMLLAFILLVAGKVTPHPLSIVATKRSFDLDCPDLAVAIVRRCSGIGRFFNYAAGAIVMSILACGGVQYSMLEWRRFRL